MEEGIPVRRLCRVKRRNNRAVRGAEIDNTASELNRGVAGKRKEE